ncbi:dTDP-4-dehydrorhamnose reductase [bacterium]|nr:dTDP-4-dehydrorhamnose reductase [bacterium]
MKVLVAGAKGMLGHDLIPALKHTGHLVVSSGLQPSDEPDYVRMDITDVAQVREAFAAVRPEAVINCAAYTNVDAAETDEANAYRINALGSWNLALACQAAEIPLMYVSTDYVFDGTKGSAYDEYDLPNPQSVYGRSKRAGEIHVERLCTKHYIVRTAWLYGRGGKNFVETILKAASEKPELKVVNDQWGSPTCTTDLAQAMTALLTTERFGTYHVTGSGVCTWHDFAKKIIELSGLQTPILPQTTEELNRPAPRPRYSMLSHRALGLAALPAMTQWETSLERYLASRAKP